MSTTDWKVPASAQPKPGSYGYDLDRALSSVMTLTAGVPPDAFTADTLGTERAGNAVLIGEDGLVLTVGYLITEATTVWLTLNDGRVASGTVVGIDPESGLGLVQALSRLDLPVLPLGRSSTVRVGDPVVVAGAGGRRRSVAATVTSRQEFAGYWEYLLDEAFFTAPAHPHWGGTAMIGATGELLGIGSLQLQQDRGGGAEHLNMVVPVDLLPPVMSDLLSTGRPGRPVRPWMGIYATEIDDQIAVAGVAPRGPAEGAGLRTGDLLLEVAGRKVRTLAECFRAVWALGSAGTVIPLTIHREGRRLDVAVTSTDRTSLLRRPVMH